MAVGAAAGLWFIGALGMWDQAMQTLAIILVSVCFCILVGLPLGVLAASSRMFRRGLIPVRSTPAQVRKSRIRTRYAAA